MEIKTKKDILKEYDEEEDRDGVYDDQKFVAVDDVLKFIEDKFVFGGENMGLELLKDILNGKRKWK